MQRNNLILLSIFLAGFLISGMLFYQGLKDEFSSKNPLNSVQEKPEQVLGEAVLSQSPKPQPVQSTDDENRVKVLKVVDGDTIEVLINGEKKNIRFIGIDTPETVDPRRPVGCFGKEASDENKRLLEGKVVILEKDISETDKYNRLLRYVYLPLDDGTLLFVNDYLVRQGFAQASTYPPDVRESDRFLKAQAEARDNNRGLWGACKK